MAETKWVHLTEILRHTDNRDINPTNRPFHVYVFYATISFIKKKDYGTTVTLVDGNVSVIFFFERVEFQNRGAAHLHIVLWTEATINEMISSN